MARWGEVGLQPNGLFERACPTAAARMHGPGETPHHAAAAGARGCQHAAAPYEGGAGVAARGPHARVSRRSPHAAWVCEWRSPDIIGWRR